MKNIKGYLKKAVVSMIAAVLLIGSVPSAEVKADGVKPKTVAINVKSKTVKTGQAFKLYAKITPAGADDDYLRWSIVEGKNVIRFDDDDRDDDEAEFKAVKTGTAKVCCYIKGTSKKAYATITVKTGTGSNPSSGTIKRVGAQKRTVERGDDFELEVKKSAGVRDRDLKWSIADRSIVRFDDDDRYGDEMEFEARKTGTTKITCKNTKTGKSVTFTVTVVRDDD